MSVKKKSKKKTLIRLMSDSGYFIVRSITSGTAQKKLEFRKYDPNVRKHVLFKQKKVT